MLKNTEKLWSCKISIPALKNAFLCSDNLQKEEVSIKTALTTAHKLNTISQVFLTTATALFYTQGLFNFLFYILRFKVQHFKIFSSILVIYNCI